MINTFGYFGMSYEQASREAERVIKEQGWFKSWDRLCQLRQIMQQHLKNGEAA